MEKLIELLNEREKTVNGVQYPGWCKEHLEYQCHGPRVINKRFCFIKWLVENNKIDFTKDCIIEFGYYGTEGHCDKYDNILMNLAIEDNPIEFLISILK